MSSLVLLVVCLAAGALARATGRAPAGSSRVLSRLVVDLALPALTLLVVHDAPAVASAPSLALALAAPWAAFAASTAAVLVASRAFGLPRATTAVMILGAGLGNTSFVGFPLVEALYGRDALADAVVVDQATFLLLALVAPAVVAWGKGESPPRARDALARVLAFPAFGALLVALATRSFAYPPALHALLERLGALVTPLALLAVGEHVVVPARALLRHARELGLGLVLRLALAPALVLLVARALGAAPGRAFDVAMVEIGMPPMVTAALLAIEAGVAPELAALFVGLGVPISLASAPAWATLLARLH